MKPGKSSSEFHLIVASMILMIANGTEYVNIPWETVQWYLGAISVYAGGRQWVKKQPNGLEK